MAYEPEICINCGAWIQEDDQSEDPNYCKECYRERHNEDEHDQ